ncbi:MAG: hypothetical protein WD648_14125 [Planctomycetaceae bacterium]
MRTVVAAVAGMLVGVLAETSVVRGGDVSIHSVESWSTAFGGEESAYHFNVESTRRIDARASWVLSAKERVLARGTLQVQAGPNAPGKIEIRLKLPEARPELVLPLSLNVSVDDASGPAAIEKSLWLFPKDPFADQRQRLEKMKIVLFDPVKTTADVFRKMKIPFEETRSPEGVNDGMLIVGEGVSFREFRQLPRQLIEAAGRGVSVLCLAPESGTAPLPLFNGEDGPQPTRFVLGRSDMITQLDKRLDAASWPPDGEVVSSSIVLSAQRSGIVGDVESTNKGWAWLEADFGDKGGKLVVCGFAIIKKWDSGPTPRFLFERVLSHFDKH